MNRKYVLLIAITVVLASCKSSQHADLGDGLFADIQTSKGDIVVKLEDQKTPITVANFVSLAEGKSPFVSDSLKGKKYFDGLIFHRVIKDFMIQGGDPTGTGSGNPGYKFKNEIVDSLNFGKPGVLAMANAGANTNGSQFFITHKPTPFLNGRYTAFGHVVEGMNVVDSIANVKTSQDPTTKDRPVVDVVMNKVEIIRNGKEAKKYDAVKVMTDYFAEETAKEKEQEKQKAEFVAELEKQKAEAETLPSGLKVYTLKKGEGEKPKIGQKVLVYYAGYLENGDLFDSNMEAVAQKYGRFDPARKQGHGYDPIPMDYGPDAQLIAGFREGLMNMKVGDKVRLFTPSHLGYGTSGAGSVIPPNTDLIFDLEITGLAN
ncbi:peptidylprolyl isomerase [Flavobacteriaceae bacterium F89]|uniref:peptidylprolyl isomerase n=1 Tax=Cerina litoralis TaxID=2874477 RepID=A0AAE3JQY9_9FLAO|nr:peptidylprolyl isomerase [Cerina litoralis]MCG2460753.1 peptidylprolyl isomerase [Cerina litoralis]